MRWTKKNNTNTTDAIAKIIAKAVEFNTGVEAKLLRFDEKKYEYPGLDKAVSVFLSFVKQQKKIAMHGDYDADGVTSLCQDKIMVPALHVSNCIIYPPKRFTDGFGVKVSHIEWYHKQGVELLILQDNGIAAVEPVAKAKEYGMTVIILDHHTPPTDETTGEYILPDADVIVDPHVTGGDFDDLCGSGITFRFWNKVMDACPWMSDKYKWVLRKKLSCFAAIGTIGDVVTLLGDNRLIVKEGLDAISRGFASVGLQVLMREAGMEHVTSTAVAFGLAPIINAYGRLEDDGPRFMLNLLTATTESEELVEMCKTAIQRNKDRKQQEKEAMERAEYLMRDHQDDRFIVLIDEQVTSGIAGLVSGKLTEKYNRPSIVLGPKMGSDELVKGSGRSVEGTDIFEILTSAADFIDTFGGHAGACGITLARNQFDAFVSMVNKLAPIPKVIDSIAYDAEGDIADASEWVKQINYYQPFGAGNPELIIRFNNVPITNRFTMGEAKEHLKLVNEHAAIVWFGGADKYIEMGSPECVDVIGKLSLNVFRGNATVQIQVVDLVPAGESYS